MAENIQEIKESQSKPPHLNEYLFKAVNTAKLATIPVPDSFFLGRIGQEASWLVSHVIKRPELPEAGVVGYFDQDKFKLTKRAIGDTAHVHLPKPDNGIRAAIVAHLHMIDSPPHIGDLEYVLVSPDDPLAVPAALVVTPSTKMLILRTLDTPDIPPHILKSQIKLITKDPVMQLEQDLLEEYKNSLGGRLEALPILARVSQARMFLLTRIAQQFKLKIFSCSINENIAKAVN